MINSVKAAVLTGVAMSSLSIAFPANAQSSDDTVRSAPQESVTSGLEDIIVTAERYETSLQRTPIAVTAVSGSDLKARGVATLLDLQTFTPGLQIGSRTAQGNQQGSFSIRGIGVDATGSSPSVGIYIDEVYYPSGAGNLLGLFDVQRVEVLRGPQGTLFGRNTIAGAVQYISVKPGDTATGFAEFTGGSFNRRDISAGVTLPLSDTLSLRASGQILHRDGFVHDDLNDIDRGSDRVRQGRIQVRWTPDPRLTIDLKGEIVGQRNNGRTLAVLDIVPTAALALVATNQMLLGPFAYTGPFDASLVSRRRYQIAGFNSEDSFKFNYWSGQGTIRYEISDAVTLKSITAYSRSRQRSMVDFDATPAAIVAGIGGNPEIIDLFTQELQLSGRSFDSKLRWTAGLYYYNSRDDDRGRGFVLGLFPPAIGFQPSNGDTVIKDRAIAGYAQGTYSLSDQFSFTLGLRYSDERIRARNDSFPRPPLATSFSDTSPLVSLNFQATPDVLLYAKASKGFRAGGFSVSNSLPAGFLAYDPETAWTYEAGARVGLFDRRLRINPTIFYTDWKDIQFNLIVPAAGAGTPIPITANAGDARISGAELEAQLAATKSLLFVVSAATLDGNYRNITPGLALSKSSDLQRAPKFKYSLGGRYTYELANAATIGANIDWSHTSTQRSATTDTDSIRMPAFGLLNARLQYTAPNKRWSLAVFGTNLTKEYYYIGGAGISFAAAAGPITADLGRPREFGATLNIGF